MIEIIFLTLFFLITSHYFIFPAFTFVFALFVKKPINRKEIYPAVSLIIAAYNEKKVIAEKINNSFALDYPEDKLEIIIVSDGSTDETPNIVNSYKDRGVISLHDPPRKGKTAALNRAVDCATGEIIVFSDANSMYDPKAIKMLVRNFNDSTVGGVTGRKSIVQSMDRESSRGDSLFWKFESTIKVRQSRINSITTGDGEIFAIRRNLYIKIPEYVINDDTAITFNIIKKDLRVVYEPYAISREEASIVIKDDFNVKARMVCGGYQTLALYWDMLFPPKNFFAFQFIVHKVLRWAMPLLLISLYSCNIFLLYGFFLWFLFLQSIFYFSALSGLFLKKSGYNLGVIYWPYYYCTMNVAAVIGLFHFLTGKSGVKIWKKAAR